MRFFTSRWWLAPLAALGIASCGPRNGPSDSGVRVPPAEDSGMPVDDMLSFDGGCNEVAQIGDLVSEVQVNSAPPQSVGGWYPAGTYTLTSATVYTGPNGATGSDGNSYRMTLDVISEGATDLYQFVQSRQGQTDYRYTISADIMHQPANVSVSTWTCPGCGDSCDGGMPLLPYDGTNTSLTLYVSGDGGTTIAQSYVFVHM